MRILAHRLHSDELLAYIILRLSQVRVIVPYRQMPEGVNFTVYRFFHERGWIGQPFLGESPDVTPIAEADRLFKYTLKKIEALLKGLRYSGVVGMECVARKNEVGVLRLHTILPADLYEALTPLAKEIKGVASGLLEHYPEFAGRLDNEAATREYLEPSPLAQELVRLKLLRRQHDG